MIADLGISDEEAKQAIEALADESLERVGDIRELEDNDWEDLGISLELINWFKNTISTEPKTYMPI